MKRKIAGLNCGLLGLAMFMGLPMVVAQPRVDGGIDQTTRETAQELWRDGPRISPFTGVRWRDTTPEVRVKGTWYELVSLNDLPADQIVGFCQQVDEKDWQKRFQEDLPAVLILMGHDPGTTAKLDLKDLQTGKEQILEKVEMTEKNRSQIYNARIEQEAKESAEPTTAPTTEPAGGQ